MLLFLFPFWGYISEPQVEPVKEQSLSIETCVEALASHDPELVLANLAEDARLKLSEDIQKKVAKIDAECRASDDRLALVQKTFTVERIAEVVKVRRAAAWKGAHRRYQPPFAFLISLFAVGTGFMVIYFWLRTSRKKSRS